MAVPDFSGPRGAPAPAAAPAPQTSAVGGVVFPSAAPAAEDRTNPAPLLGTSNRTGALAVMTGDGPAAVLPAGGPGLEPKLKLPVGSAGERTGGLPEARRGPVRAEAADAGVPDLTHLRGGHLVTPQQQGVV